MWPFLFVGGQACVVVPARFAQHAGRGCGSSLSVAEEHALVLDLLHHIVGHKLLGGESVLGGAEREFCGSKVRAVFRHLADVVLVLNFELGREELAANVAHLTWLAREGRADAFLVSADSDGARQRSAAFVS